MIHPTAAVGENVRLGQRVQIGPGAIVDGSVTIGDDVVIHEYVIIRGVVTLAPRCRVGPFTAIEGALVVGDDTLLDSQFRLCETSGHSPTHIGSQCVIRSGVVIYEGVEIGDQVSIGHHTVIRPGARIESKVSIGSFNQIEGECEIKEATRFHSNVHISMFSKVGAHCFIAPGFVSTNTPYPLSEAPSRDIRGVTIEDHTKIGANVTTAPGVTIGKNSLIGVGTVVQEDVPPNTFAIGATKLVKMRVDHLKVPGTLDKPYHFRD